jgi:hypothetical protein
LITAVSAVAAEGAKPSEHQEPDPIVSGFIDLVKTLDDISITVTAVADVDSRYLLSGRIMYSKTVNMLSLEVLGNPIFEGLVLIIDNEDQLVYLSPPSSDLALRMTTEVAAAQLSGLGINIGNGASIMESLSHLLPIDLLSNFELEPLGPAEEDDRSYYLIKCTPKDNTEEESNPEDYSVLWIDASTYHPCRVEQYSDGECAAAFAMTNSSYNTGLVKEDFMGPLQRKSIEDYF